MCSVEFSSFSYQQTKLSSWTPTLILFVDPCAHFWILICALLNWKMSSEKSCCVPHCNVTRNDKVTLHSFPNPDKDSNRFRSWLYNIGGDILALDNQYIYKHRRVCHKHFEVKFHTWTRSLSRDAVPTLHLPGLPKRILSDITNTVNVDQAVVQPGTSTVMNPNVPKSPKSLSPTFTLKRPQVPSIKNPSNLTRKIMRLKRQKDSYAARLKKALNLSQNQTFQKCLSKFSTLAAIFTVMQFREISKNKMGRRFTKEEKIMALSLYKQGPRAYRWLSKIFVLPSPLTLSRLISRVGIKPGINKKIFWQLKKRTEAMSKDEKLCILLFDEIAISPHFDYNRKKDCVSGFVTNGTETKRKIADHALVFMIRGVLKNYKQPIAYTFCCGTTPSIELKILIQKMISELQNCGLKVLATVCDQGATNVSAINALIEDTRREYLRKNENHTRDTFEVNGREIIPLFDPPHLIKGIRNNLITKNLKYTMDGAVKVAKWDHIMQLYEENPAYKGIRLIKNLTELHVNPKKIAKMKVKYATQVFSKTVATNMGYLADKGILQQECKDTADVLLFFDELFDSMNGSYEKSRKKSGKYLLGPLTPKSEHSKTWTTAKTILRTMKFVTKEGRESSVPSITNWFRTLDNMDILKNKLFNEYNIKSIWMRHFNQDPLENFFGCIRSHGYRNISPTPSGFESAFASLLIGNISNHSRGSNCEEDFCKNFDSMNNLFSKDDQETLQKNIEVDFEDTNCEIIDFDVKKRDPKIIAQLCYVTGYLLRQAKKNVYRNCSKCKDNLVCPTNPNEYLVRREYFNFKRCLTYPSESLIKFFSEMQDIITYVIEKRSQTIDIKNYCKTLITIIVDFQLFKCDKHKSNLIDFLMDLSCRFFICNWCRDVNKILNGTRTENNVNDSIKMLAMEVYRKKNKLKIN